METLKDKERATIKDIAEMSKKLNNEQRKKLLYIGYGMGLASVANGNK